MSIRSLRAAGTCECVAIIFCCFWFDETRDACHYVQMPNDAKRHAILAAADEQFAQYGYRKTSMDDIAQRLGVSRASLYTYFTNKDEIFRSVSKAVHERALAAAKTHLVDTTGARDLDGDVEQGLLARHRPFQKAVTESPHGDELFDEYSRLCKDIVLESHTRFQLMLASRLRVASRAGLIDLKPAGVSAPAAAEVLNLAAAGLKHRAPDVATFEKRVSKLVRVFMTGLR